MLLRHSTIYLLARGLPGVLSFVAIALYSRLLTPEGYGQYALVIAAVGLADVIGFQWLRLGVVRFLPAHDTRLQGFLSSAVAGFGLMAGVALAIALAALPVVVNRGLVLFGAALLISSGLLSFLQDLARIQLAPFRYGALAISRGVLSLGLTVCLILAGFDVWGLLGGMVLGALVPALVAGGGVLSQLRLSAVTLPLLRLMFVYGAPLSATLALTFVVDSSDRFMIAWLLDEAAVGRYSAGYHLAQASVGVLLSIINMAAYPLAVRALEEEGATAARSQLHQNLTALLALGLPAAIGFALLADNIAAVVLGEAFRDEATRIMPVIALAVLLGGIKAFYFDLSFQLGRKTLVQVWVAAAAATINLVGNMLLIPTLGTLGAAWATLLAYGVALLMSAFWGGRVFRLPAPGRDPTLIVVATLTMTAALWPFVAEHGPTWLMLQVGGGALVYGGALVALNVAGLRGRLARQVSKLLRYT